MGILQNIFHNKSIRRLRQMLEWVRMRDFSQQYSLSNLSGEERRMAEEINAVMREFKEMEHRRVGESLLFDAMLSEVDSLLIAADANGRMRWMNRAAVDGLCGFRIDNLDSLSALDATLPLKLKQVKRGRNQLVVFTTPRGEEKQYAVSMSEVFVRGILYRIYSMQSIAPIMMQGEIMAEQKLIRVLTHEIMNSLTPIVSLSQTLADGLADDSVSGTLANEDARMALEAIGRRANGLMQFVQRYRELSGIAKPVMETIKVSQLMQGLQAMPTFAGEAKGRVEFHTECSDRFVTLDPAQIEQVLINLLKNALEANATRVVVRTTASSDDRWLVISVEDNGQGFSAEATNDLFTPFFTTKQQGQGIGLALCRQILSNHGGMIAAENIADGARFKICLLMQCI